MFCCISFDSYIVTHFQISDVFLFKDCFEYIFRNDFVVAPRYSSSLQLLLSSLLITNRW
jgi:hypothetical protein